MILFQVALLPYLLLGILACWHAHAVGRARGTRVLTDAAYPAAPSSPPRGAALFGTRVGVFFRRHLALPSVLAVVWMWLNGTGLIVPLYDRMLAVAHWHAAPTRAFTTIVLLGGGTELTGPRNAPRPEGDSTEKIALTARLYHAANASRIQADGAPAAPRTPLRVIVSGGNPQHHGVTEADDYAPDLIALGIPSAAIVRERRSLNTYQNAKFVRELLPAAGNDPIVLVTTAQHMQRAMLYFKRFGFDVQPVTPPPYPPPRPSWLPTVRGFSRSTGELHELIGTAQFHVYHALHLY
ncbi:MAG: YdcF family protein [Janthinobacterium lividum]